MSDLDVRIVKLDPMRVASVRIVSESPDVESEGEIEVKDYPGGLFAVTTSKLIEDPSGRNILETWKALWEWLKASKYKWRQVHELEKVHDPMASEKDIILDLYLPIEEG